MIQTEAIEVPIRAISDKIVDGLDDDVSDYVRHQFGDATISHFTVTVHLRVYTDAERRANRDA